MYIGGGAVGAGLTDAVLALAEKLDAVIGTSLMGISLVPTDHPRFLGMQGMHGHYASSMAQKEADLIIGIGVRFSDRATGNVSKYARGARLIQLDADQAEINKNVHVDVGLVGQLSEGLILHSLTTYPPFLRRDLQTRKLRQSLFRALNTISLT